MDFGDLQADLHLKSPDNKSIFHTTKLLLAINKGHLHVVNEIVCENIAKTGCMNRIYKSVMPL